MVDVLRMMIQQDHPARDPDYYCKLNGGRHSSSCADVVGDGGDVNTAMEVSGYAGGSKEPTKDIGGALVVSLVNSTRQLKYSHYQAFRAPSVRYNSVSINSILQSMPTSIMYCRRSRQMSCCVMGSLVSMNVMVL